MRYFLATLHVNISNLVRQSIVQYCLYLMFSLFACLHWCLSCNILLYRNWLVELFQFQCRFLALACIFGFASKLSTINFFFIFYFLFLNIVKSIYMCYLLVRNLLNYPLRSTWCLFSWIFNQLHLVVHLSKLILSLKRK